MKMHTIDSAPRDGTEILVYRPLARLTGERPFCVVLTRATPRISPQGVEHYTESLSHPTHWAPLVIPDERGWRLIAQESQPLLHDGYKAIAAGPRHGTWWVLGESRVAIAHGGEAVAEIGPSDLPPGPAIPMFEAASA
ncbi:hypothetical protein [Paracoccus sp. ME4]|uniref:hypothetical protein n=1 Tax=Paracoccus sp. ME4 TaxID=3138066 RepID=UPI00398AB4E7